MKRHWNEAPWPSNAHFRAFFSYAHEDGEADPPLIEALTHELERRVNVRLVNDRFEIWLDEKGIRTGDKWDPKIVDELHASDILIVLLTPCWIGSDYCRREYAIFERVERDRTVGDYVAGYIAPILVRDIEKQKANFNDEQREIYARIRARQSQKALARDFLMLSSSKRKEFIEKIADDIEGMIERRRALPLVSPDATHHPPAPPLRKAREYDPKAHDFEEFDFVAGAEVLVDRPQGNELRGVYAQVDFTQRLYVENAGARIEFGVRCAYWSFRNNGAGKLSQADDLRSKPGRLNAYYLTRLVEPENIVLCIEPESGRSGLAELALPPSANENRLARVATASSDVDVSQLKSQLDVTLGPEGLWVAEEKGQALSQRSMRWIEAIMTVAAKHDMSVHHTGRLSRSIPAKERA